jgi:hypothetical protein
MAGDGVRQTFAPFPTRGQNYFFCPRSGKLNIRRITAVSVWARCDMSSNEHSEATALFRGGRLMDLLGTGVPSRLSDVV